MEENKVHYSKVTLQSAFIGLVGGAIIGGGIGYTMEKTAIGILLGGLSGALIGFLIGRAQEMPSSNPHVLYENTEELELIRGPDRRIQKIVRRVKAKRNE